MQRALHHRRHRGNPAGRVFQVPRGPVTSPKVKPPVAALLLFFIAAFASGPAIAAALDGYRSKPADWFRSDEGRGVIRNVLAWQTPSGAWPKNTDTAADPRRPSTGTEAGGTFDNGATTGELRFLARAMDVTHDPAVGSAFRRGLDHILSAQYTNGGWPQRFPPGNGYHRHITFNDHAMVRLLEFVRDVARSNDFSFVDADRRKMAAASFDRGIDCILRCQVIVGGRRTVWCAQHDEVTLEPRPARTFELASLSGAESAGILRLLMSLDRPSPAVRQAIEAGAAWFDAVQIRGIRIARVDGDKRVVPDAAAPPLWARFYEIGTNRPIFAGRDGLKKYDVAEIEAERRNGYAWHGDWGLAVARDYQKWRARSALSN